MGIKIQNKSDRIHIRAIFFFLLIFFLVISIPIHQAKSQSNLNGVLQNYLAAQTTGDYEFIAARNRLRFQFEKPTDFGGLTIELDLIHTFNKSQNIQFLLKEAYLDWYLDKYDLRIGHQKIIWGRANGAFVTDIITPVDLREFLTVSAEDIRFGVTSFNAIRYFGANSFQFVFSPFPQHDLLPAVDSRWFPAQQISNIFSSIPVTSDTEEEPYSVEDIQLALRYSLFSPQNMDMDFFLMRWTHPNPAYNPTFDLSNVPDFPSINLVETYQNSWMAGMSASLKIHSKLFLLIESLYVRKKLFTSLPFSDTSFIESISDAFTLIEDVEFNGDFLVSKPWIHSMAGIRTELLKTTIEGQFFVEGIFDYEDDIIQKEVYRYAALLAARSFLGNRLQMLTLSRYNIDTKDYWVQLQGQYELTDNLQLTLGTNLFGGEKSRELSGHLSFSQYRNNSFIFSKIALFF